MYDWEYSTEGELVSEILEKKAKQPKIYCIHCKKEVWWRMPRPDDPCYECGEPIAGEVS